MLPFAALAGICDANLPPPARTMSFAVNSSSPWPLYDNTTLLKPVTFEPSLTAINTGARVAIERQVGWNRQLRLTALPPNSYLIGKAVVSMLVTLPALILVFIAGATVGHVSLTPTEWLATGVSVWLGLIPFAVLGLVIGFAGTVDSVQPISMLCYLGLSILGGLWFPVEMFPTFLQAIAKVTPSYWLADLGRSVLAGDGVPMTAVLVLAAWSVALGVLGAFAYSRSGKKV